MIRSAAIIVITMVFLAIMAAAIAFSVKAWPKSPRPPTALPTLELNS